MFSRTFRFPLRASLWRYERQARLGGRNSFHEAVIARRATDNTSTCTIDTIDPNKLWTKTRPFEHVPWLSPRTTEGTVRFLGPTKDSQPASLNFKKGEEHQTNFGPSLEKKVNVTDLRYMKPQTTLAFEGIEWVYAPSVLSEDKLLAHDKDAVEVFIRGQYFEECAGLVKNRTGAARSIAYNYRHRQIEEDTNLADPYKFSSKPLPNFHMDNDATTAEVNLRRVLGDEEAEHWLSKRWGIINVWRPVGDVVRQWPLALVDSSGLRPSDIAPIYTRNNYKTHFTALKYSPKFRFYYVSNLAPDEALLFVDFLSGGKNAASLAPPLGIAHGAFEDHGAPEIVPKRRSVEVRCLVLYDD
ncbi:hypothetical protein GGS24DRAFT_517781 [Hypoxylon argillaceum]|nr:hypothetical protein GGS24DRAFT_517781 [Hypoxylon argillaceum]